MASRSMNGKLILENMIVEDRRMISLLLKVHVLEKRGKSANNVPGVDFKSATDCRSVVVEFEDRGPTIELLKGKGGKLTTLSEKLRKLGDDRKFVIVSEGHDCTIEKDPDSIKVEQFRVAQLSTIPIRNFTEGMRVIADAVSIRETASTSFNEYSSRSHAVTSVALVRRLGKTQTKKQTVTAHFVDLAGCEQAVDKTTPFINTTLSSLSTTIRDLGKSQKKDSKIIWRANKLLQLLKGSMTGSSQTILIATGYGSVLGSTRPFTIGTLQFAENCKKVKFRTQRAETHFDEKKADELKATVLQKMSEQRKRIQELEAQLAEMQQSTESSASDLAQREEELASLRASRAALDEERAALEKERDDALKERELAMEDLKTAHFKEKERIVEELLRFNSESVSKELLDIDDDEDIDEEDADASDDSSQRLLAERRQFKAAKEALVEGRDKVMGQVGAMLRDSTLPLDERVGAAMSQVTKYLSVLQHQTYSLLKENYDLSCRLELADSEREDVERELETTIAKCDQTADQRDRLYDSIVELQRAVGLEDF